ncbi:hypothetical protein WICMUC_005949 [Wickerhamomyces mucosus]|uniref:Glu-AdT subunit F n=1 Tax=Wickerhamomyces mucosus TaxID=1378264 RepID=A0A9P8T225_9ASCO|nr:hypothetical protein WICMUC_005949 [Wickerhamomyces mucosus]
MNFSQVIRKSSTLASAKQIKNFINTPKTYIHKDLVESIREIEIEDDKLIKLIKLSGLQIPDDLDHYRIPLKLQAGFLSKLHELSPEIVDFEYNKSKTLDLQAIYDSIEANHPNESKGEAPDNDSKLLKLSEITLNGHYVVREGLIKNK